MGFWGWFFIAFGAALLVGVVPFFVMGLILYEKLLVRTSKDLWKREMSMPSDEEYAKLFTEGQVWRTAHLDAMEEVHIRNEGFNLYGEYFDFGGRNAVIILPGRMETCLYSDYYADVYAEAGLNVLTIDNRSHGKSDGRYNAIGFRECSDVIAWARFLHETKGIGRVMLHGVCIGASAAVTTLTTAHCPDYVAGMVGEGVYGSFAELLRRHIEERGHRYFPIGPISLFYLWLTTGADAVHDGPKKRLPLLKKPILMLHSKEDRFSLPARAEALFESAGSEKKRLVWFDHGAHSRIRIHTPENRAKYDAAVKEFVSEVLDEKS